jgi:lipopolysaccharide/colanic/teichoic acid biosynthesis glycosyltransferase
MLTLRQRFAKRTFDLVLSLILLVLFGRWGRPFKILKIKTMRPVEGISTTVTARNDVRITPLGRWLRRAKIDELPQVINVLIGDMSFVGPRPDVPGFADQLTGENRNILSLRPGITGPATLAFRNEEETLANMVDPDRYNKEVIYPSKVVMNLEYLKNHSFYRDFQLIFETVIKSGSKRSKEHSVPIPKDRTH